MTTTATTTTTKRSQRIRLAIELTEERVERNDREATKFLSTAAEDLSRALVWASNAAAADEESKILRPLLAACADPSAGDDELLGFFREEVGRLARTLTEYAPEITSTSWFRNGVGLARLEAQQRTLRFLRDCVRSIEKAGEQG